MFRKLGEFFKHLNLLALSIPITILIASAAFPLRPVVQQALIAIILIWFGLEAMSGFPFWKA